MSDKNKLLITTGLASVVGIAGIAFALGAFDKSSNGGTTANPEAVPAPKDRLVAQAGETKCNPCAAKKCNPCAAKCNPCAAAKCNPCAAKCNPCAAKCNPCAAAKCNPCNPCAAKKCNPCNPCAAKKCNPCAANPCSPCNPCNPCNPCAPQAGGELSDDEAAAAYAGLLSAPNPYESAGKAATDYRNWNMYNRVPYQSATHGGRYVNNYADETAAPYGKFESFGEMPVGSILAKDSFVVDGGGKVSPGPLFLMRKMAAGFRPDFGDWEYTLIMPGGDVYGVTNGSGSENVEFCGTCHLAVSNQDHMFFLPVEYRKK